MKPGWATTEFYVTVGGLVASVLVAGGWVQPADKEALGGVITNGIAAAAAVIAAAIQVSAYCYSRAHVKSSAVFQRLDSEPPPRDIATITNRELKP